MNDFMSYIYTILLLKIYAYLIKYIVFFIDLNIICNNHILVFIMSKKSKVLCGIQNTIIHIYKKLNQV